MKRDEKQTREKFLMSGTTDNLGQKIFVLRRHMNFKLENPTV